MVLYGPRSSGCFVYDHLEWTSLDCNVVGWNGRLQSLLKELALPLELSADPTISLRWYP